MNGNSAALDMSFKDNYTSSKKTEPPQVINLRRVLIQIKTRGDI